MPLIDHTEQLTPEQILISIVTARAGTEYETAPRHVVLGRRTANEHLAVTPVVDTDGAYTGRWSVMHIPTGLAVTHVSNPDRAHEAAGAVADLDWSTITGPDSITEDFKAAVTAAFSAIRQVDPFATDYEPTHADRWAEARDGAPIPRGALSLAAWSLEQVQEGHKRTLDPDYEHAVPSYVPGTETEEQPRGEPNPLWTMWLVRNADQFAIGYLLLVLHRVAPQAAEQAATFIAGQWEAGDSIGEWSWDLAHAIDTGQVDTMELPAAPPASGSLLAESGQT